MLTTIIIIRHIIIVSKITNDKNDTVRSGEYVYIWLLQNQYKAAKY